MKYIINSPQVISEIASGEAVVINLETGSYYNLGEDSAKIWSYLIEGADLAELKNKTNSSTSASKEEINTKIDFFLAQLQKEGLIKETENSSALTNDITINIEKLELEIYTDMQDLLGLDPIHEVDAKVGWPVQG